MRMFLWRISLVGVACVFFVQMGFAQAGGKVAAPGRSAKPEPKTAYPMLPPITLQFKTSSQGLGIPLMVGLSGSPFCSASGTVYMKASFPPKYTGSTLISVSPKGEMRDYNLTSAPGLVNMTVGDVDVRGSDVYAVARAEKIEELRDNELNPGPAAAKKAQYFHYFLLHFSHPMTAPSETQLDLPFTPMKLAATGNGTFVMLGFDKVNDLPVIAVLDDTGQLVREIDSAGKFDDLQSRVASMERFFASRSAMNYHVSDLYLMQTASMQLTQFHDSVLLLMRGADAKVLTIQSDGEMTSTSLHLSPGTMAMSIVPSSGEDWLVRAINSAAGITKSTLILKVDPSDGEVLQKIHTGVVPNFYVTCAHNGDYTGVRWVGKKGDKKMVLVRAHS